MLELLLENKKRYYAWLAFLVLIIGLAGILYIVQLLSGLQFTNLSRDVSWGFYIAQFTFFVGIAAGSVVLAIPAYIHKSEALRPLLVYGEFLAVASVVMCMLFIVVDMGQPQRLLNMILYPSPSSVMFWDMLVLFGYLVLNLIIGWVSLESERVGTKPPNWIKVLVYVSIIWAISIHTVTAFLYSGLPARHYWFSAIMAPRFLASAFCSGPSILLLLLFILRRLTNITLSREAIKKLTTIITYAMCANVFFYLCEVFTAAYGAMPAQIHPFNYLFFGHEGTLIWINVCMWGAVVLAFFSLALLIPPALRYNEALLPWSLGMLIIATWIDKGLALLIGGFTPNSFEEITSYVPSFTEIGISLGIYAIGILVLSLLWSIAVKVKNIS